MTMKTPFAPFSPGYWVGFVLFCLLRACGAASAQAQADKQLDAIAARGVLRVGSTGDYKPFSYRAAQGGEFIGLDLEMAGGLARALGVKLEVVPTSWPTL